MLYREITANGHLPVFIQEMLIGIGSFHPFCADPVFCPVHIRGGVGRLDGGNDHELPELREVGRRNDLRMFYPPAAVGVIGEVLAVEVEQDTVS
ncbi:hypothetical protein D9M69_555370 [compost metagenome]